MSAVQLDIELLLLEIEVLFERFRTLSQESRAIILGKLKIKLLEEFKDFIIQESDINQETVVEISYGRIVDDGTSKDADIIELPVELADDIENYCESTTIDNPDHDYFPSIETVQMKPEKDTSATINPTQKPLQQNNVINLEKPSKEPKTKTCLICNYCGRQYEKRKMFKTHLKRHENNRKYECASCSVRFNVKDDLIKHLKTHSSEKNFKCLICSKPFVNNVWLKNHIKVVHEKSDKHFCQKCDYFSFSTHTLKEHVKRKHEKIYKKYACLICKHIFICKAELKIHLRSHTGEKPYKCELCDATFVRSGTLTNHKKFVHGEKKFPCEICDKSFKTSYKLKRHFLIHTRSKPYACPFCNYASNTQGNLNKHVKVIHHVEDFSYTKYKKTMLGVVEDVKEEWIKNAEPFTKEYLDSLSNSNGSVTIEQLKEQYLQQKKKKTTTEKNTDNSNSNLIGLSN